MKLFDNLRLPQSASRFLPDLRWLRGDAPSGGEQLICFKARKDMNKKYTGHCACSQVTYGFDTEPTFIANCHCVDCKRASGGEAAVPDTDFTVFSGSTRSFSYGPNTETCAGRGIDRVFCANCGSRVFNNKLKDFPGIVFVQEGTLDRLNEWLAPKVEIFTLSCQKWARPLDLPQFDHGPN